MASSPLGVHTCFLARYPRRRSQRVRGVPLTPLMEQGVLQGGLPLMYTMAVGRAVTRKRK